MISGCIAPRCDSQRQPGSLFCRNCEQAPAGQRGGWISAENRRRRMVAKGDVRLDASNVATRLWIGGQPPFDVDLPSFDVLVLCAKELQPPHVAFHGKVIRCPIRDGVLDHQELTSSVLVAKEAGDALLRGKRVLVTCAMGLNRSALVAGLALARVTRMTADQIILQIKRRRGAPALSNEHFQDVLRRLLNRRR